MRAAPSESRGGERSDDHRQQDDQTGCRHYLSHSRIGLHRFAPLENTMSDRRLDVLAHLSTVGSAALQGRRSSATGRIDANRARVGSITVPRRASRRLRNIDNSVFVSGRAPGPPNRKPRQETGKAGERQQAEKQEPRNSETRKSRIFSSSHRPPPARPVPRPPGPLPSSPLPTADPPWTKGLKGELSLIRSPSQCQGPRSQVRMPATIAPFRTENQHCGRLCAARNERSRNPE